jgi:glycosyltransferase involved in cell wall biosynthesis
MIYNPRKDDGCRWKLTENNQNKIVFISRVTDDKGVTVLMDAIESIKKDGINISLDIYGPMDKNYETYFNERVKNSNGVIIYKGVLKPEEVQPVLLSYHFLVLPTYHSGEGLPGILVEAGMTGIPIIITRFNSLPEYFTHEQSALFVEPRDVDGLKKEILKLIGNKELTYQINSGLLKTVEPFKLENVIKQSLWYLSAKNWKF